MCGIAGLIHKGKSSNVGSEMTAMLQALKHRGPDSTGYAVYGEPKEGDYIMRLKVAEADDMNRGHGIHQTILDRVNAVEAILKEHGEEVASKTNATEYALRYVLTHVGDTAKMAEHIEKLGKSLNTSVGHFNAMNSSLDKRVMPTMRKFQDLSIAPPDKPMPEPKRIETTADAGAGAQLELIKKAKA